MRIFLVCDFHPHETIIQMARDIHDFIRNGLIVQADGDGGDTANRMGLWFIGRYLSGESEKKLKLEFLMRCDCLEPRDNGIWIRHPKVDENTPSFWYDPHEFARDQQIPIVIAMGMLGTKHWLKRIFQRHVRRLGKYQNSDIASPECLSRYIRAFRRTNLLYWPILMLGDMFTLMNTLIIAVRRLMNPENVSPDLNHTITLIQALQCSPTILAKVSRWLYALTDPGAAWRHYFRKETGAPPFDELYEQLIRKWICQNKDTRFT